VHQHQRADDRGPPRCCRPSVADNAGRNAANPRLPDEHPRLIDKYEKRKSPYGQVYYWAAGHGLDFRAADSGSDVDVVLKGEIAVTPLKFDLTEHASLQKWRRV
jgi:broad specificity polyphosphatase/5'/3'-nucleotidase SurE